MFIIHATPKRMAMIAEGIPSNQLMVNGCAVFGKSLVKMVSMEIIIPDVIRMIPTNH